MKVCDICKNVKEKSFEIKIQILKTEEKKGETTERKVLNISVDMCENHISALCQNLGDMIKTMKSISSETSQEIVK